MAETAHYDLVIIGSGSGNSLLTPYWDDKNVASIDGGIFGGTCLNNGCIPTKMFLYPADHAAMTDRLSALGVDMEVTGTDYAAIRDRVFGIIDPISEGGAEYRANGEHTTLYPEYAHFTGPKELTTDSGAVITGDQIVIAAGSRPVLPAEISGLDHPAVHTNVDMMRLSDLPRRTVVLGGGFIASEAAAMFHGLGSEVTQINRSATLLRAFDHDVSQTFTEVAGKAWTVQLAQQVTAVEDGGDDGAAATVVTEGSDGTEYRYPADAVIVAMGRVPNSDTLNLAATDVATHDDDRIVVNDFQQVLDKHGKVIEGIWSLGDINSEYQLKHVSNLEARTVMNNLENPDSMVRSDHRFVPAAVFTQPQVATVGLTEAEAIDQYGADAVAVKKQYYRDTAYGWAMGAEEEFAKVIVSKAGNRILGMHIVGEQAATLIQPILTAMQFDIPADKLARGQYWIHPALTEVVENALLGTVDVPY
ncbi:mycothione reductase [Micrococcoides hystricis]|uniref:Mycothione reductase n=1 Tax=Micrococcoides hystricis TaxID=1572761 RepID=A0ABV6P6W0_9MICC